MKLRKALDKAKQERQSASMVEAPKKVVMLQKAAQQESSQWKAPVYSQSNHHPLDARKARLNRCVCISSDAPEIDDYKVLRTQIHHRANPKGWNTFMVTSAHAGEGKTLTCINLALTFAKEYHHTVLLCDCDLKQQCIHRYLGYDSPHGLVDYMVDDTPLNDLIVWPGIEKLTIISGGKTIRESTEMLAAPKMKSLVQEMKTRYPDRFVLFDMPPILNQADAQAFAPLVDGIIVVVQADKTPVQDVKKALEAIPKDKLIGFILNRQKTNSFSAKRATRPASISSGSSV